MFWRDFLASFHWVFAYRSFLFVRNCFFIQFIYVYTSMALHLIVSSPSYTCYHTLKCLKFLRRDFNAFCSWFLLIGTLICFFIQGIILYTFHTRSSYFYSIKIVYGLSEAYKHHLLSPELSYISLYSLASNMCSQCSCNSVWLAIIHKYST